MGAKFLKLVSKHFPPSNPLSKIINRRTVKMSYRCTENMSKIISAHNSKIIREQKNEEERKCSCINKEDCPLGGQCLIKDIIYQATVTTLSNLDEGDQPTPTLDEGDQPPPPWMKKNNLPPLALANRKPTWDCVPRSSKKDYQTTTHHSSTLKSATQQL